MLFFNGHGTLTLSITIITALNNDYWVELNIIFFQYKTDAFEPMAGPSPSSTTTRT